MRQKIKIVLLSLVIVFSGFMWWYNETYSMEVVETRELNSPELENRLLIATQGSDYKNGVVKRVINKIGGSAYVKIIDVGLLKDVDPNSWDAILIMHTWQVWKPEPNAEQFVKDSYDASKMFVLSTSGGGDQALEGVDGITGASVLENVNKDADTIVLWLHKLIEF